MKKLTFISCLLLSGCLAGAMAANKKQPIYKDAKAPIEERVNDLVSRMTLEEKVQQLNPVSYTHLTLPTNSRV